ncbi:MAG: family 78 glycoside hydrolase catalytic domain [Mangrovibacterium sp.]
MKTREKRKSYRRSIFCAMIWIAMGCTHQNLHLQPVNLCTEYLENPINIGTPAPRLTWRFEGQDPVFSVSKAEVTIWDDPKQESTTIHIKKETSPGETLITSVSVPDTLKPLTRYWWNVKVWDRQGKRWRTSKLASFETAMFSEKNWQARWITDNHNKEYEQAPLFRKNIEVRDKKILYARLYVSATGYYEMFINGNRVGKNYLDPGFTDFSKRILYSVHDITNLLAKGENTLSAVLGNGWYNVQDSATWDFHKAAWRTRPRLLAEFHIRYSDGTKDVVLSDSTWKTSMGAYTYNGIYSGGHVDLRLEEKGWQLPGFNDSKWQQAKEVPSPSPLLVAQQMPGIRITKEFHATEMKKFSNRLYVYTFPKNMAGFCHLKVKGAPGTVVKLRYGELLKKNGRLEQGNVDFFFYSKKPGEAFQQDEVILRDSNEMVEFTPSFTYHGFQYVEVESSKPIELTEESLTALFVHTDVKPVGSFECSNPVLNKIWEATRQSYLSNLHSIPTDCPQREKNGWTADAHVSVDLGLLNYDAITVYEKWMNDFIDMQREQGDITAIIPSSGWGWGKSTGPVWDAALFIVPEALYQYYGDSRCIQKMIPVQNRYLAYLEREEENGLLPFGLGDWVPYKSKTNNTYTSTAYYYLDYKLRASFAKILGEDDSRFLAKAEKIRNDINDHFFDAETNTYAEGTQTAQALALYLGLPPEGKEKQVAEKLHELVAGNNYFLDFGVIGSKTVPRMLTKYGYVEDAMKMVTKTEAPSWGYWVDKLGYTTLAEEWMVDPVKNGSSLNHVFLGDVSAWMVNDLAGINYDPQNPGFSHILITPHFVKDLSRVKGQYQSVKGLISSEWKREDGKVTLNVTIPEGCHASIITEDGQKTNVGSGKHQLEF